MKIKLNTSDIKVSAYIYKLKRTDIEDDNIYIGSTKDVFTRLQEHISKYKSNSTRKLYDYIRKNGDINNWEMVIIDKIEYNTRRELINKEREYFELYKPSLNMKKMGSYS